MLFSRQFVSAAVGAIVVVAGYASAACTREYIVQEGDYCDKISAEHKASTYQLATLNTPKINTGCTNLIPGDTLCLGAAENEDCQETYVVKSGDTCDEISTLGGFNNTLLQLNNPQIDDNCSNIYVGEVLCVASSVQVPAGNGAVIVNPATSPSPAGATAGPISVVSTPKAVPTAPPPASVVGGDDDDDSEIPFCDELEDDDD